MIQRVGNENNRRVSIVVVCSVVVFLEEIFDEISLEKVSY